MPHIFQVGAGSGGMPVLDMLSRDPRVTAITLVEPDIYKPHNVERHLFPASAVGRPKAELARQWLLDRRPELQVQTVQCDLLDPNRQGDIERLAHEADLGICAADNEPAKYHFDSLMRRLGKAWTLGEVLSGGIGGFVHWFVPGGPCYGCVASHLQREVVVDRPPVPDYSRPGGPVAETTIPASMAAIHAVASLHALVSLDLLGEQPGYQPGFTSLLLTLRRVPDVFQEAFRPYRFRIPRMPGCLVCQAGGNLAKSSAEDLDVALDQALARLGNE
jgi:molybdopterin/thiamine biosynthesis adenylyltransferase